MRRKLKRNLKGNSLCWFKNERPLNITWEEDPLTNIPGITPKIVKH